MDLGKYYLDVVTKTSGGITYEKLAEILKQKMAPGTVVEMIDNTGGAPRTYIRLSLQASLEEANAVRQQIGDIPGACLPSLNRADPV